MNADGKFLLVLTSDDQCDAGWLNQRATFKTWTGISEAVIANAHPFYALGTQDGDVDLLWFTGQLYRKFKVHGGRVTALALSSDDRLLASAGEINETGKSPRPGIKLFDREGDGFERTLTSPTSSSIGSIEFARDNANLLALAEDGIGSVWDVHTGQLLASLRPAGAGLSAARFTPDGSAVIGGTRTGDVFVWKLGGPIEEPRKVAEEVVQRVRQGQFAELGSDYLVQEAWSHLNPDAKWEQRKRDGLSAVQQPPPRQQPVYSPCIKADRRIPTCAWR